MSVNRDMLIKDEFWLKKALELAHCAAAGGEVPVGAVLVRENEIIGQGYNQPIKTSDPTAHAEMVALRAGALKMQNYRLLETTLYVTLEPCVMCVGAMLHARIQRLVFGAYDLKTGAVESIAKLLDLESCNHRIIHQGGVLAEECGELLRAFFRARRK